MTYLEIFLGSNLFFLKGNFVPGLYSRITVIDITVKCLGRI
jgi:hypothetical protein